MNDPDVTASQIRTIQILGSIAIIASPVSLVYGGVVLSLIALICALVAWSKINALQGQEDVSEQVLGTLRRQVRVGLIVSVGTLVVNGVFVAMTLSTVIPLLQEGNYDELYRMFGMAPDAAGDLSGNASEPANVSVWDR